MIKTLLALLLTAQTLALQVSHFSTGSTAMRNVDVSSFIWFVVIGVVVCIIITAVVCYLFRAQPETQNNYLAQNQHAQTYDQHGGYEMGYVDIIRIIRMRRVTINSRLITQRTIIDLDGINLINLVA